MGSTTPPEPQSLVCKTEMTQLTLPSGQPADCMTHPLNVHLLLQSRQVAAELIADAKAALASYDPAKAAPLVGLAEYILGRQN